MADIFISYTSSDRDWAFWVGHELQALGHTPRIHEWEIPAGGDIAAWMEARHDAADHILCIVSSAYLAKPYSAWERRAAQWAAVTDRPNFAVPVFVEPCKAPTLFAHLKRCDLYGLSEEDAGARLKAFLAPVGIPPREGFPGGATISSVPDQPPSRFPGKAAVSNVPIGVAPHFMGRDDALAAIGTALQRNQGGTAITVLHGMRGVGKTTLAAAYAEYHRSDYRATWWIRAQTEPTLRADLVGLGIRLGWVDADEKEEPAVEAVMERLRHEGERLLLIFDNAIDANALKPYLPRGGQAKVLVTSNARAWRGVGTPVEIPTWPNDIGADYLIARTGRTSERAAAEALSQALDGLPLAHEQAAAYCERLEVSLVDYRRRFEAEPARLLDNARDAPAEYHNRLTVAKTFALAIDEAAKLHGAAEPLIVHAALLAPEPIPLFVFKEAREHFGDPLASALVDEGLDEAISSLRAFALVERDQIVEERDPAITTDAIRLHRLVREIAASRRDGDQQYAARRTLVSVLAAVYPDDGYSNSASWPRCATLTPHLVAICNSETADAADSAQRADLLGRAGVYFYGRAAYAAARPLVERALAIVEKALGPEHPDTGDSLNNLAHLLKEQGDLAAARPLFERALAIREKVLGTEHPYTAASLDSLGSLLQDQGDLAAARPLHERALAIREKALGPEHPDTAISLDNFARLLQEQGDLAAARLLRERTLAIREKKLGPGHPHTATSLDNLASLLRDQDDLAAARPLHERALAIYEKTLGPEHPYTAASLAGLALSLQEQGDLAAARPLHERALAIVEKALGPEHPDTATSLDNFARLLKDQGDLAAARLLRERALAIREKVLGPEHPHTAASLDSLGSLLQDQGDLAAARPLHERALAIYEKTLGPEHPHTATSLDNFARLLKDQGDLAAARLLRERALAIREKVLGPEHPYTAASLAGLALSLQEQGDLAAARPLHERALAICEKKLGPEHPYTAASLAGLALSLQEQGDLAAARPLHERALAIYEKTLGPEHPHTAISLNNFARLLEEQGDLAAARPLHERALAIREKALGSEHPDTAISLDNLARLLRSKGDLAAARPLHERALAIFEKAFGPEHRDTNRTRCHLARLLITSGHAREALGPAETALRAHEKVLGPNHRWTKDTVRVTAEALDALGRADQAAALRARYGVERDRENR